MMEAKPAKDPVQRCAVTPAAESALSTRSASSPRALVDGHGETGRGQQGKQIGFKGAGDALGGVASYTQADGDARDGVRGRGGDGDERMGIGNAKGLLSPPLR